MPQRSRSGSSADAIEIRALPNSQLEGCVIAATIFKAKHMTVFARIDHQAEAAAVGLTLPPTEVIIFGNGKGGTPLMQAGRTAAIDLPLKALVWQEASGKTWLSYNDPEWIAKRHGLGRESRKSVTAMAAMLESVAK